MSGCTGAAQTVSVAVDGRGAGAGPGYCRWLVGGRGRQPEGGAAGGGCRLGGEAGGGVGYGGRLYGGAG